MQDSMRDFWIKDNLPDDKNFSPEAVKILMRLAYDEGRKRERSAKSEDERERLHGPAFI